MLNYFLKLYQYFNYLSLDVAIGASLLSASISYYLNGTIYWNFAICLGIAVWIIYTFDHLIDAHKSSESLSINRHIFHKRHSKSFVIFIILASILGWVMVLELAQYTIIWGLILLGFVFLYFILIMFFKQFYLKEILVAIVYAFGVFLGPVSTYLLEVDIQIVSLLVQLILIAFANLSLFSLIEYELDIQDNHPSLARKMGKIKTERVIKTVLIVTVAIQLSSMLGFGYSPFQLSFLMMTILLSLVYKHADDLTRNELYRWVADAVFFIPAIMLFF